MLFFCCCFFSFLLFVMFFFLFCLFFFVLFCQCSFSYEHQQSRRRQSVPYALNAASSRNLGKSVAAVAVVLGPETAELLVTSNLITRGITASRHAKHCRSPRKPSSNIRTRLNSETPLMGLTWQTQQQSLRLQTRLHSRPPTRRYQ